MTHRLQLWQFTSDAGHEFVLVRWVAAPSFTLADAVRRERFPGYDNTPSLVNFFSDPMTVEEYFLAGADVVITEHFAGV
jgi:hypothetical protein